MSWFKAALVILQIVRAILRMIEEKKLESAAAAKILREALEEGDARLKAAGEAADVARASYRAGKLSDDEIGFRD